MNTDTEELLALWREMKLGRPAYLANPALIAVRDAYRAQTYAEDGILAAMQEANRQGPGLWEAISRAVVDEVSRQDRSDLAHLDATRQKAEKMGSRSLAAQLVKAAASRYNTRTEDTVARIMDGEEKP